MTIAYVSAQSGHANGSSSVASYSLTLGTAVSAGNAVCVIAGGIPASGSVSGWTLKDNVTGNTYTNAGGVKNTDGYSSCLFYGVNVQSGPTTFTLKDSAGNINFPAITLDTFSGVATASALDDDAGTLNTAPGTGTGAITTGTITVAGANELLWGGMIDEGGAGGNTPISGFTVGQAVSSTFYTAYEINPATGSKAVEWTSTVGSGVYLAEGISLKAATVSTIHGTLSETLGATTSSATATHADHAALNSTLGSLTLATSGIWAKRSATLSKTLGALTKSITAKALVKNTLSKTLGAVTGPGYSPGAFAPSGGPTYVPSQSGNYQAGSANNSSYSPTTPTITPGNSAFVLAGGVPTGGSAYTWKVSDNAENTYIKVGYQTDSSGYNTAIYFALNIQGSPTQITLYESGGNQIQYAAIVMDVFSGIPASFVQLGSSASTQIAPGTSANAITSGSFSLTNPGALVWAANVNVGSKGGVSPGTGFTQGQNDNASFATEYKLSASSGSQAATFTTTDGSDYYDTLAVALGYPVDHAAVNGTLGSVGVFATGLAPAPPYVVNGTLGSLSLSSSGTVKGHATLSKTLGAVTVAATGLLTSVRHATVSKTLGSLTSTVAANSSDTLSLTHTLGSLQLAATAIRPAHAALSVTLGVATAAAVLSPIDKLTLSKTLGATTFRGTAHNESTSHLTLSATLGPLSATFVTAKTKFTTVNSRTHLTVLGYQPGTPPIQQFPVG